MFTVQTDSSRSEHSGIPGSSTSPQDMPKDAGRSLAVGACNKSGIDFSELYTSDSCIDGYLQDFELSPGCGRCTRG